MKRFFYSLTFKIGISIVLVEIVILTVTGVYYTSQFNNQVDQRIRVKAELPGRLMDNGLLSVSAVNNKDVIKKLVGEEVLEAITVRSDGMVMYSLNLGDQTRRITDVPDVDLNWFKPDVTKNIFEIQPDGMVSVMPIHFSQSQEAQFFIYIKASMVQAESEKRYIILNFVIGSIAAVLFTSIFIIILFYFIISTRINKLLDVLKRVTSGDLKTRIEGPIWSDQIGMLQDDINAMAGQLQSVIEGLEKQVAERTVELTMSMEVGQQATAIRNLYELLPTITKFIWERFNLYYTQVYLVDDIDQNLVWKAGDGESPRELAEGVDSLPIDSSTLIGQAVIERRPMMVADVHPEVQLMRTWYSVLLEEVDKKRHDPVLPETHAELAIPLIVRGRVIGVLDMQHNQVNVFTANNLPVYEAMAVQLAIAIDSAQQWMVAQESERRMEDALRQLTREAWEEKLVSPKQKTGFIYNLSDITPVSTETPSPRPQNDLAVPLVIQDQAIGYLAVNKSSNQTWTEDEQALLQAVAQQLAQKVENLRLFEDTQQRATREQIARRIIDKVRASRSIETALKTATEELNKALGTARAVIDLQIETQPSFEPAAAQREEAADVKAAAVITPTNGRPAESPVNFGLNLG